MTKTNKYYYGISKGLGRGVYDSWYGMNGAEAAIDRELYGSVRKFKTREAAEIFAFGKLITTHDIRSFF